MEVILMATLGYQLSQIATGIAHWDRATVARYIDEAIAACGPDATPETVWAAIRAAKPTTEKLGPGRIWHAAYQVYGNEVWAPWANAQLTAQ
jgi:hypothetical protein